MPNCLSPAYGQVTYTTNSHQHVMRLPLNNVDADVSHVYNKGHTSVPTDASMLYFIELLAPLFANADSFSGVEYFTQANCASAPVYQRAYDFGGGVSGSSGVSDSAWTQAVLTFKTTLGGRFKLMLLEGGAVPDLKIALSAGVSPAMNAIRDYLVSSADIVAAYDNGYPAVPLNFVTKTNDTLRKKYLNP